MFEAAVDGLGGAVAGVGMIEVGQDVPGSGLSVRPSVTISVRELGTPASLRQAISACIRALPTLVSGAW